MPTAKVFQNGRSQAIRLPKEFRVEGDEVYLKKTPEGFLVIARDPWEIFQEGVNELSDAFLSHGRQQPAPPAANLAMIYLLDTDSLIFLIRGLKATKGKSRQQATRLVDRCRKAQAAGETLGLSAITVSELEFGAQGSDNYETEIAAVRKVLTPFEVFDYDAAACPPRYGEVRHQLEARGVSIGSMDLLIAAHALALGAVLVTNNPSHFGRVAGLKIENWVVE